MKGTIFAKDGEPDYLRALTYLSLCSEPNAYGLRLLIIERVQHDFKKVAAHFKTTDPNEARSQECERIAEKLHTWNIATQELYKGLLAFHKENNHEQAILHLYNALILGNETARIHIKEIKNAQKRELLKEQAMEDMKTEKGISPQAESSSDDDSSEEVPIATVLKPKPVIQKDLDPITESPKQYKPLKTVLTGEEKLAKALGKTKNRIGGKFQPFECPSKDENKIDTPLKIIFVHPDVEKDFNLLNPQKIQELMGYIEAKPYAIEGTGQPEILKGKYKGFKGCISRLMDAENRLVYKVTGKREILILSCSGHYK